MRARDVWFVLGTVAAGSALYWLLAGVAYAASRAAFEFWHPAIAAFVGSAWGAFNAFVACDMASDACTDCARLTEDLKAVRQALAEWKS